MLKVDLSNVWGDLSLPDLLATEQEVFAAHKTLAEGRGPGNDFLGWLELPTFEETEELQQHPPRRRALRCGIPTCSSSSGHRRLVPRPARCLSWSRARTTT